MVNVRVEDRKAVEPSSGPANRGTVAAVEGCTIGSLAKVFQQPSLRLNDGLEVPPATAW